MVLSVHGKRVDWIVYFSLNNIELEILLNNLELIVKELRASTIRDLVRPVVFKSINPSLVEKLVNRGVLKKFYKGGKNLYTVTNRGLKAFFHVVEPIIRIVNEKPGLNAAEIAELIKNRAFYGGIHRVKSTHEKLVERMLELLGLIGLVDNAEGRYYPPSREVVVNGLSSFFGKIMAVTPIRRLEDLLEEVTGMIGLDHDLADEVINRVLSHGLRVEARAPGRALFDLVIKAKKQAQENIKSGKLLESLAYEALGLEVIRSLERIGSIPKSMHEYRQYFQFYFYETLGDYFYQNLDFEAAKLCYHWAVSVARESPNMAREAHRANAKYLLSLARSLAQKNRFEEAIARLDELIGYYKSAGLIREAEIAEALRYEYMAEIEVRRNKPCTAYKSWLAAAHKYDSLGGEYRGKAEALRVKSLISRAECLLVADKNVEEAVKILEEASVKAEEILSPHLRNVARSLLHEARAGLYVSSNKLLEASREYGESAEYYELRGYTLRSLLNRARSMKFRGFHEVLNGNITGSIEFFESAINYYHQLLKNMAKQYDKKKSIDYYLVKEGIKGYYDSKALKSLVSAYNLTQSTPIINDYVINTVIQVIKDSMQFLVEAGRWREYSIAEKTLELLKSISEERRVNGLIRILGEIAEYSDELGNKYNEEESPRFRVTIKLIQELLSSIKTGLEAITRYIEEISR